MNKAMLDIKHRHRNPRMRAIHDNIVRWSVISTDDARG